MGVASAQIAKIGDNSYSTFEEAFAAVQAGETLTLLADLNLSEILVLDKAITLDGNDKKVTSTAKKAFEVYADATIKNGAIKGAVEVSATLNITELGEGSEISYISIDGDGQLFHNGLTTTIKKHITGTETEGWYTISSPVGTVGHNEVGGLLNGTHDLYRYDEPTMMWENVKDEDNGDFTTLESGRGYIYANTVDTELSFTGNLVTEPVAQAITVTDNNLKGFNLIGNPFTHNISKANLSGLTLAEGYYTLSNQGAWQAVNEGDVAPMQGVLVQATVAGDLTINPTPKRSERINNGSIVINVANAKYSDVAYVTFNDGIGLNKIEHRNAEIPMVYVPVNGKNFAIATMSQDVNEIPVSFKASTMGQYTISVEAVDCEFENMYLTDRMTGEKVNLLLEDYIFVATSNDNANRFVISFATTTPESVAENFIYINNGNMIINNIEGNAVVRVLDVLGRPVAEYNVTESANISTATLSSGVYMIQMYDNNGVKVQKVVVE